MAENSKRFVIMLGLISLSQLVLIAFELFGKYGWEKEIFYIRASVIVFCVLFSFLLTRLRKHAVKTYNIKFLAAAKTLLHIAVIFLGCFYTAYMYSLGYYTFSVFIITALIVSITHIRWPYIFNSILVLSFVILAIYLQRTYRVPEYFVDEAHTVVLLVVLISIGNILIHRRHWDIFIKENKINEINQKLVEISQIDDLTGLFNRRKILDELDKTIAWARQLSSDFCVVMIDLDNFKKVNDKLGHIEGDKALCEFADVVKSNLRKNDVFGRWGGEEFVIIIPGSKKEDAFRFVDRIRRKVEDHSFKEIGRLTFSAGICEFVPEYNDDKLIGNADFALYLSKQLGRNKVSIYAKAS